MNKINKKIVWVDDQIHTAVMRPDKDEMEANGFDIYPIDSSDMFIDFINNAKTLDDYACIIIDLMMPVGEILDIKKVRRNIDTGLELIKRCKKKFKNSKIVVYTQLKDPEKAKNYCNDKGIPFWEKDEILPSKLVSNLKDYVGR